MPRVALFSFAHSRAARTLMSQRILLILDDAAASRSIQDALINSGEGFTDIEWVGDCHGALSKLHEAKNSALVPGIAAILVELSLPDSRGIETFDRLFEVLPQIPILILCDAEGEEIAKLAVQHGAQDYLFKDRLDSYLLPKAVRSMIERAAVSEALFVEKERAQVTLNSIGDAVLCTDISGQVTYLNVIAEGLTGWTQEEAIGHKLEVVFRIVDGTTRRTAENPLALSIRENKTVSLTPNCVLIRRDGAEASIEDSSAPIHDRRGQVIGAVMVFHDVSLARATTERMSYLAQHDSLTDLPNRVLMNDRLVEAIALSDRHKRKLAILFLDLDLFKHINDSLGHVVGDRVLQSVGRRLSTCVRSSDTVSRQGGDEFVILLWEVRHSRDAAVAAEKIFRALREPHLIDKHELHITGSIGIVTYPDDGADAESLLKNADAAMYHAKESGRDSYQFFKPEMNVRALERQGLEADLRRAIERQDLQLHYQPKVDLVSGAIVGVEALIRWRHPQRGLVPPIQFVAIAEECGLIIPMGRWVLREACRQARAWQLDGSPPVCMAINISSVELRSPHFAAGVLAILKETGLDPRYLELELTETFLMLDSKSTAEVLDELKVIGVQLALDDFGTGYSSLSYLKRFPIDVLKIDRSFVSDLTDDTDDAGIVAAVISLGKSLHMQVVAEGVETRAQLEFLQAHGCPVGQGFLFSEALPTAEITQLMRIGSTGGARLKQFALTTGPSIAAAPLEDTGEVRKRVSRSDTRRARHLKLRGANGDEIEIKASEAGAR
jgi:diguanylate cyclase (GGDEF)-like protein/PAS domain S-box-containing protein